MVIIESTDFLRQSRFSAGFTENSFNTQQKTLPDASVFCVNERSVRALRSPVHVTNYYVGKRFYDNLCFCK